MIATSWLALLFMPADDRRKIEKAASLDVNAVIMDLEDGVALNRKAEARASAVAALQEVNFGASARIVRINAVGSTEFAADVDALAAAPLPDGIAIPKVESAEQVQQVAEKLPVGLIAMIESALGIVNLREIAQATPHLIALAFGAEDYSSSIGAPRTREGREVFWAQSAVVAHAKAQRLAAFDTPFLDLADIDGLRRDVENAAGLGYSGKLAIHPRQITPIVEGFAPKLEDIQRAQALIAAHEAHQTAGVGVFAFEGRMIDMPVIRAAETTLKRARAAGIFSD